MPISLVFAQNAAVFEQLAQDVEEVYVHNVSEFELHVVLHQIRVQQLGIKMLELFPDEFEGVTKEMLTPILAAHDYAKMNGMFKGKKISHWLFYYFGKATYELTEDEKLLRTELILELNRQDEAHFVKLIKNQDLKKYPSLIKKISMIEHVADLVDRGMDPVANVEFGHLRDGKKMIKASVYLKRESEIAAYLAAKLERVYKKTVEDFNFTNPFGLCNLLLSVHH